MAKKHRKRPRPDMPTFSIDASFLDQLPEELREGMAVFFDEQEQERKKRLVAENLSYQTLQADTLLSHDGWYEVDAGMELTDAAYNELEEGWISPREQQPVPAVGPSIHQFYHDLYGWSALDEMNAVVDSEYPLLDPDTGEPSAPPEPYIPLGPGVLVNHRDREHPYQVYEDYQGFLAGVGEETSFIYMGSFWQPESGFLIAKRNAMKTIGGFCVDIDRFEDETGQYFQADWVMSSLVEEFERTPELEPNYLMLSGTGIQLWYVFGERIPLLSARRSPRRKKYDALLKRLYAWFDKTLPRNRFKVDVPCATISHAFRAPGSPSKHGYPTRLFVKGGRLRKMISPLDLSDFLGGDLKPYDLEDWDQEEYMRIRQEAADRDWNNRPATAKQVAYLGKLHAMSCIEAVPDKLTQADADRLIKQAEVVFTRRSQYRQTKGGYIDTTEGRRVPRAKRHSGLYRYTLDRMHHETPAGSRYNAMFGLAGLAWNCGVPKSQAEHDLMGLLGTEWALRPGSDGLPLSRSDVRAAMRGWNPLGALRTREQLEHRLKWSYNPPAKRNGRKQEEHLRRARLLQSGDYPNGEWRYVPPTKEAQIKAYAAAHPEANHSEIARALGVSRPTVIKWLKHEAQ